MSTNSEIHTYYRYAFYYIDMFHIKLAEIFDIAHSKHKITRGSLMRLAPMSFRIFINNMSLIYV